MARLTAAERAKLPDRAFAYIDSKGKRRLPIYDAAHVRNALARFNQVEFDDEAGRETARNRLLRAAQKHRIVPVGFISSQLRIERERGERGGAEPIDLPTGFVTLLMTDIEESTALLEHLGKGYGEVLNEVRDIHRLTVGDHGGCVVEARADDFFAAFESPEGALAAAIAIQRTMRAHQWRDDLEVAVRIGLHAGYPTRREDNYIGMAVHTAARISSAAHGGQIVISGDTKTALTGMTPAAVRLIDLGIHKLKGIRGEHQLFQVASEGIARESFPPLRT